MKYLIKLRFAKDYLESIKTLDRVDGILHDTKLLNDSLIALQPGELDTIQEALQDIRNELAEHEYTARRCASTDESCATCYCWHSERCRCSQPIPVQVDGKLNWLQPLTSPHDWCLCWTTAALED